MKKQKAIRAGLFLLALLLALTACAQREPGETTAGLTSPTEATVPETAPATEPPSVDPAETTSDKPRFVLTPEQKERYEDLLVKAKEFTHNNRENAYGYLNGVLGGRIDPNAPRLDAATALKIVEENDDFDTILKKFGEIQSSCDYWGEGGTFWVEYWLDYTIVDGKLFVPERVYANLVLHVIYFRQYEIGQPYSARPVSGRTLFPKNAS
ncbi:MAG: hypothetical protein IJR89_07375 [Clostridia bacterium]|nr:hypothetical protein [Clostridia bacterium]